MKKDFSLLFKMMKNGTTTVFTCARMAVECNVNILLIRNEGKKA